MSFIDPDLRDQWRANDEKRAADARRLADARKQGPALTLKETDVEPTDHIMQFFAFAHLPPHLQDVSRPFGEMAEWIVKTIPRNPERTKALNKLLEAKDAAVRALVAK